MSLILVVDDRAINREFLATLLGYYGHRVIEAADGAEALTLTRAQHPELVISDVLMPVMDGVEFANRLHADPSIADIPIIFYTATYRLKEGRILAQSCGVFSVLAKPAEPKAIIDAIDAALGTASQLPAPAPLPATTALPARFAASKVSAHLGDLTELRLRIQKIVEAGLDLIGEQGELHQVSEGLIQAFGTVQASSLRLAAVLELGLDLASERQPQQLLELFCRAAQDIMNARYASLCLDDGDGDGMQRATTRGMSEETSTFFRALDPSGGLLEQLLGEGRTRRLSGLNGRLARLGLAPPQPPIQSFLAVPVTSATRAYGWLYVADKLGTDEFSEEDEEFASTLAAQLALAYENLHLYGQARQHVAQLETEIAERRRMQEEVQIREEQFRSLAETAVDSIVTADASSRIIFWNSGAQRTFGYSSAEIIGQPLQRLMPEHYRRGCLQGIAHFLDSGQNHVIGKTVEVTALKKDGTEFPIDLSLATWSSREQVFFTAIIHDITERHEQQERIARLSRIQAVLSGINSAIVRLHEPLALFNEACRVAVDEGQFAMAWIGLIDRDGQGGTFVAGIGPKESAERRFTVSVDGPCPVGQALRSQRPAFCNDIAVMPTPDLFLDAAQCSGCRSLIALPLLREQRVVGVMVLYAKESGFFDDKELLLLNELAGDISFALEYIDKAEQLDYLVYYDALTGLANRSLIHDRLQQLLQAPRAEPDDRKLVALALVNIERFKNINDSFGRHSGDVLLKQIAERLAGALGSRDHLARLGSDHFAVILADIGESTTEIARVVGDVLLASLDRPFDIDQHDLHITTKAGVALFPSDGSDADTLFANAETALHKAARAEERYLFYAPPMNARVAEQLTLENKLHKALAREEFVLHYQPKVDLQNGQVIGLEALLRWQDPDNGLVPPKDFIPALEETGLIVEVGRWALEKAVADYEAWHAAGLQPPRIAVNVSAMQLRRKDFLTTLENALSRRPGQRNYLDLELTESILMEDIEANVRRLGAARKMGVKIAIDDFGTGYSSLSYLKRFPIDQLKIDESFVRDITTDPDAAAICIAVIGLAHNLKLKVIAEGVETDAQMNYLRRHRCDEMQGFLFSRPLPAEQCAQLFAGHTTLALPTETTEKSKTLLIVDDESNVLQALKRVLRKDGYEILTASSAYEGFELLANHRVQVILSDQRMPGMNGTEFLSRVRELYPDTIRIVLSGYTDLETITEAVNRGAIYRFLTKPWDDDLLREHIREAFRHQEVSTQHQRYPAEQK